MQVIRFNMNKNRLKNLIHDLGIFSATVIRFLKYVAKKHPLLVGGIFTFAVLEAVLPTFMAFINAKMFDSLINIVSGQVGNIPKISFASLFLIPRTLATYLALYILVFIISDIVSRLSSILRFDLQKYLEMEIEVDVTNKISTLDMTHFDNPSVNDLISKVTTRSKLAALTSFNQSVNIVGIVANFILHLSILTALSPLIILVIVFLALPESIIYAKYSKKILSVWNAMTESRRDATTTSSYLYSDKFIKEIRLFNSLEYFIGRYKRLMKASLIPQLSINHQRSLLGMAFGLFSSVGYGFVLLLLFSFVLAQHITVGTFTFYVNSINRLRDSVKDLLAAFARMYEDSVHAQYLFKLFDLKNNIVSGNKKLEKTGRPPFIEFKDVSFKYPNSDKLVFNNFNLKIGPGEHVALVGVNGAGKTTLVKLLSRFYDATEGQVLIDGNNIKDLDLGGWFSNLAILFQDYNFYHFDAKTNIALGNISLLNSEQDIKKASELAQSHEFIEKYENKYNQVLKKSFSGGIDPSIGQQQRIALARLFLNNAPILVLDEPTSAIDPKAESEIFESLFNYAKEKTVIIVSHRFSTVRNADRIIVLDDGNVVEEGSHEELIKKDSGIYKAAFELQKRGYE